jgi:hypothetical protein
MKKLRVGLALVMLAFGALAQPAAVVRNAYTTNASPYAEFSAKFTDTNAYNFCVAAGVSNQFGIESMEGLITELKVGNCWTGLVDGFVFKTNLGANVDRVYSIKNLSTNANKADLAYTSAGLQCNYSTTFIQWSNMNVPPTNTLIVRIRGKAKNSKTGLGDRPAIIGAYSGDVASTILSFDRWWSPQAKENSSESTAITTYMQDLTGEYETGCAPVYQTVAVSFNNTATKGYFNGYSLGANGCKSTGINVTSTLPIIQFGMKYHGASAMDNPTGDEIIAGFVFAGVLTSNQIECVERALRWTEPNTSEDLFIGDSWMFLQCNTNGVDSPTFFQSWPMQYMQKSAQKKNINAWWDYAYSGQLSSSWAVNGQAYSKLTNFYRCHPLNSRVTRINVKYCIGINDVYQNVTNTTTILNISNTLAFLKSWNWHVSSFTLHGAGYNYSSNNTYTWWNNGCDTNRVQINMWLRSHPEMYDTLYDIAPLFTHTNDMSLTNLNVSSDGLHLTPWGNERWTDLMLRQDAFVPRIVSSYSTNGTYLWSTSTNIYNQ